jgi:hypothetical protein
LLDAIEDLKDQGLTTPRVIHTFFSRRVLPLKMRPRMPSTPAILLRQTDLSSAWSLAHHQFPLRRWIIIIPLFMLFIFI